LRFNDFWYDDFGRYCLVGWKVHSETSGVLCVNNCAMSPLSLLYTFPMLWSFGANGLSSVFFVLLIYSIFDSCFLEKKKACSTFETKSPRKASCYSPKVFVFSCFFLSIVMIHGRSCYYFPCRSFATELTTTHQGLPEESCEHPVEPFNFVVQDRFCIYLLFQLTKRRKPGKSPSYSES
jgi:hypothetical protein